MTSHGNGPINAIHKAIQMCVWAEIQLSHFCPNISKEPPAELQVEINIKPRLAV